jgi:hypothetical protein
LFAFVFCLWVASQILHADGQPFDLSGPKVDIHVKRGAAVNSGNPGGPGRDFVQASDR